MELVSDEEFLRHSKGNYNIPTQPSDQSRPQEYLAGKHRSFFPPSPAFIEGSKASPTNKKFDKFGGGFADDSYIF